MLFENGRSIHETSKILRYHYFDYDNQSHEINVETYFSELKKNNQIHNYFEFNKYAHDAIISNWILRNDQLTYIVSSYDNPDIKFQIIYSNLQKLQIYRINKKGYPIKCRKYFKPKKFLYDEICSLNNNCIEHAVIFWIGKNRRGKLIWIFRAEKIVIVNI